MEELMLQNLENTRINMDKIKSVWFHIFDDETCENHMRELIEHTNRVYDNILMESIEKQNQIEDAIKALQEEAMDLQRQLKVNITLPDITDDMPLLNVETEIDKSIKDLRELLNKRREEICELLLQQDSLCEELGESPRPLLADPLPSAEDIDEFRNHLDVLRQERSSRLNEVLSLRSKIKAYMSTLELVPLTDIDDRLLNQRYPPLTPETLAALRTMEKEYNDQIQELKLRIDTMREKIEKLWDRLPEQDQGHLQNIRSKTSYDQSTHDILQMELQRCQTLRRQNLKQYVLKLREEIVEWWEKNLTSETERKRFSYFQNDCYNDDLLTLHELELEDLKRHYLTNQVIYELFADRKVLWDRMAALEAKANEPGRFNNRGGQLLKEERERKTIATKLPKIEQQIKDLVQIYEERENKPFLVYGQNIIEQMSAEWEIKRLEKEKLSSARKQGRTPQAKGMPPPRTPLSLKTSMSTSTASLRKAPSTANLVHPGTSTGNANKRKLNSKETSTPNAKRSLMQALSSPAPKTQLKLSNLNSSNGAGKNFRSPMRTKRVIASTVVRKPKGRYSNGSTTKRRSVNKSGTRPSPRIAVTVPSGDEENYETFQNLIAPEARSSTFPQSSDKLLRSKTNMRRVSPAIKASVKRTRAQQYIDSHVDSQSEVDEADRISRLPKPRYVPTPSKLPHFSGGSSFGTHGHDASIGSARKLTTKNLPIMM